MNVAVEPTSVANVLYECKDAIAIITINRPKVLNALDQVTLTQLREAFETAREDASVLGVILTGAAATERSSRGLTLASLRGSASSKPRPIRARARLCSISSRRSASR